MAIQIKYPHSNSGDWVNPENAYADNDTYASADTSTDYIHLYHTWYNFGFSIPSGSTINSITVNIRHKDGGGVARVLNIFTLKNNENVGDSNAHYAGETTSEITTTKTDNGTWTAEELNLNDLTGFAIKLDAYSAIYNMITYVDYISVEVDYTLPRSKYFAQLV